MIHGHIALVRLLRDFMERSQLPWANAEFRYDKDDEGRLILDERRAELSFALGGHSVDVVIHAPSDDASDGMERLPLGKLAARCGDRVVKGPIDQVTWDTIVTMIQTNAEAANV